LRIIWRSESVAQDTQVKIIFITIIIYWGKAIFILHIILYLTTWIYFINCNIAPYSYFPHVLSLYILYVELQTMQYFNCIIDCNIVPYSYLSHVLSLHGLYIELQTLKYIKCIIKFNIVPYIYFLIFCPYISCIYSYRLWNVLTV